MSLRTDSALPVAAERAIDGSTFVARPLGSSVSSSFVSISVAVVLSARGASMVRVCLAGAGLYALAQTAIGVRAR